MSTRSFSIVQLDVFTSRPLEGNQLAVISDGRGLSDAEMQRLARETNLSETTFILPREAEVERREGHQVRIFTVNEELPFAGHPTLGTAWYLRQQIRLPDEIVLDLKVGRIPVRFEQRDGRLFGEMRQSEPQFGAHPPTRRGGQSAGYSGCGTGRELAHRDGLHRNGVHHGPIPFAGHVAAAQRQLVADGALSCGRG